MSTKFKLGKKAARPLLKSTPRFSRIADSLPPSLPENTKYMEVVNGANFQMFMNNTLGCCAIAGAANGVILFTTLDNNKVIVFQNDEIVAYYSHISGYVPGDSGTDNGCVLADVLKDWKDNGIPNKENRVDKIAGYAYVDPKNIEHVKQAIDNFGCIYIGMSMPAYWDNNPYMEIWTNIPAGQAYSVGGHCVLGVGHTDAGFQIATWGMVKTITYDQWNTFMDEAWIIISPDYVGPDGVSPLKTTIPQMLAAMTTL